MNYEIVVDSGETPNKCTIAPLAYRTDFHLFPVKGEGALGPLSASVLLHHEGECLSSFRLLPAAEVTIASIDCIWRRLPRLFSRLEWAGERPPLLAKIPHGFKTVYPRVGRPETDPEGGLATIEAIFVAAALLGNWDPTLLSHYYFGRQFVEANRDRFLDLGITQAACPDQWPIHAAPVRNSLHRRINRGRGPK